MTKKTGDSLLDEGPIAFERFRDAMKKIVSVPKNAMTRQERKKDSRKKRKAALSP